MVDGQFEHRVPDRLLVAGRIRVRAGLDVPDQARRHVIGRARPEYSHGLRRVEHVVRVRRRAVDEVRRRRRIHEHRFRVAGYHAHVPEQLDNLCV